MKRVRKNSKGGLAGEAGISRNWLSQILSGEAPSWETAKRLAELTGSDPTRWMEKDVSYINNAVDDYVYEQSQRQEKANESHQNIGA